ncbi:MAG: hypothetical protein CME64_08170 [Halobacteriovoraceae bacterium]|nr:hypothetical protein [Halobacteriovoraceae bacterium]
MFMKIAVIGVDHNPIKKPFEGGLECFIYNLTKSYEDMGMDTTLYAHEDSDTNLPLRRLRDSSYVDWMLDITKQSFDIVHNNSISPFPILWAIKTGTRMITTLHTPPYTHLKCAAIFSNKHDNVSYIAPSKYLAKLWEPFTGKKIQVIPNGMDTNFWKTKKANPNCALWTGRILPTKGTDIAIKACLSAEIPLKIAGPISDMTYFREKISPHLGSSISYLGHLNQTEVKSCYKNSAVSIFSPRWGEPFGLTTIESMATGTPVAGFGTGAFPELISKKSGIVSKFKTIDSLSKAIKCSLNLENNSVVRDAARFCHTKMIQRYLRQMELVI